MKNWVVILLLFLVACAGSQTPLENQVSETEPVSVVSLAQTSVSKKNYLGGCQTINPSKTKEQVLYRNVRPGQTNESEVELLLGNPIEKNTLKGETNWVYPGLGLSTKNGIVTYILVSIDENSDLTLKQVVLT
jgi:hypothetical protein